MFRQSSQPYGYWVFGPSTKHPNGDYYNDAFPDGVPSIWLLSQILSCGDAVEIPVDTDYSMDEGL